MSYKSLEDLENNYDGDKRSKEYKELKKQFTIEDGGLGDIVETVTETLGIKKTKDCGCNERKEQLNNLPFFKRKVTVYRCMTDEHKKQYKEYLKRRSLTSWTNEDIKLLTDIYAHVFAKQYRPNEMCRNCDGTAKILLKITKHLDKVFESYED